MRSSLLNSLQNNSMKTACYLFYSIFHSLKFLYLRILF